MRIAVITDSSLKEELLSTGLDESAKISWLSTPEKINATDCYIDLLFDQTQERVAALSGLDNALIIINDIFQQVNVPDHFVRINGWHTLLSGRVVEASGRKEMQQRAEKVFALFKKEISWLPTQPGFITPRVISMIVNEAYLALDEKVSTKDDIDTAMKLGTNYPFGPFEWGRKIGLKNIHGLLEKLSNENKKYKPAPLLSTEAAQS